MALLVLGWSLQIKELYRKALSRGASLILLVLAERWNCVKALRTSGAWAEKWHSREQYKSADAMRLGKGRRRSNFTANQAKRAWLQTLICKDSYPFWKPKAQLF